LESLILAQNERWRRA